MPSASVATYSAASVAAGSLSSKDTRSIAAAVGACVGAAVIILIIGLVILRRRRQRGQTLSLDFFAGFLAMRPKDENDKEKSGEIAERGIVDDYSVRSISMKSAPVPSYSEFAVDRKRDMERKSTGLNFNKTEPPA
jgi:hypothetical protein